MPVLSEDHVHSASPSTSYIFLVLLAAVIGITVSRRRNNSSQLAPKPLVSEKQLSWTAQKQQEEEEAEGDRAKPRIPRPPQPPPFLSTKALSPHLVHAGPEFPGSLPSPTLSLSPVITAPPMLPSGSTSSSPGSFASPFESTAPAAYSWTNPAAVNVEDGIPRRRSYTKTVPINGSEPFPVSVSDGFPITGAGLGDGFPITGAGIGLGGAAMGMGGEIAVNGEIVTSPTEGWRRHTRVFGGGVCKACEESEQRMSA